MSHDVSVVGTFGEIRIKNLAEYVNSEYSQSFDNYEDAKMYLLEDRDDYVFVEERIFKIYPDKEESDNHYGITVLNPNSISVDKMMFSAYFYNGGTCLRELVEDWIKQYIIKGE